MRAPLPGVRVARRPSEGFSLFELLTAMVIVGILAQIALPNFKAMKAKARAVDVIGDIEVVEQAVRGYQADMVTWPPEAGPGVIPAGLERYLPDGFSFVGEGFQLDWENIRIPGGLPSAPGMTRVLGVGVVTDEDDLADALVAVLGESSWLVIGSAYIRVLDIG